MQTRNAQCNESLHFSAAIHAQAQSEAQAAIQVGWWVRHKRGKRQTAPEITQLPVISSVGETERPKTHSPCKANKHTATERVEPIKKEIGQVISSIKIPASSVFLYSFIDRQSFGEMSFRGRWGNHGQIDSCGTWKLSYVANSPHNHQVCRKFVNLLIICLWVGLSELYSKSLTINQFGQEDEWLQLFLTREFMYLSITCKRSGLRWEFKFTTRSTIA